MIVKIHGRFLAKAANRDTWGRIADDMDRRTAPVPPMENLQPQQKAKSSNLSD